MIVNNLFHILSSNNLVLNLPNFLIFPITFNSWLTAIKSLFNCALATAVRYGSFVIYHFQYAISPHHVFHIVCNQLISSQNSHKSCNVSFIVSDINSGSILFRFFIHSLI
ncbi:MAG: hypothetical protein Q8S84_03240 [bacterium]|nr:hypothetical protein [bacterium]